jgi:NADH-quinone oxidoreductase subunit C
LGENTITIGSLSGKMRTHDGAVVIEVSNNEWSNAAIQLYKQGYTTLISLSAIDFPKENKLEVIASLTGYELAGKPRVVELVTSISRDNPVITSLTTVFPSAEFHEREAFEMFGIEFKGHPDLRHLLLDPEEYTGIHPLRKDFVVKEEPIFLQQKKPEAEEK